MAVLRENNWLGQQRLDIPQLRSLESQVRGDFDLAIGTIFAGKAPVIVKGFALTATTVGSPAAAIEVVVADSISTNFYATESGSMFVVPSNRANEVLSSLNAKVIGSFTASATNYVGMDIRRLADATTSDILQFLNATTLLETSRTVPLGRTLDYRFIVSTTDFSSRPNITPIAIVTTDSSNNISAIRDARQLAFRLAPGGSFASIQGSYGFPGGRSESPTVLDMTSGDKAIASQYDWMKAAMTRIQEIGGGEFWYSATADRNVTMIWNGTVFSNGENFEVVTGDLHWQGIKFIFDNSTGYFNEVADQLTDVVGLTDLVDGECIYVDLDRTQNLSGGDALVAQKGVMSTLGPGSVPGARNIIAWMSDGLIYTRQSRYPVGSIPYDMIPATTAANGLIRISRDYLGNVVAGLSGLNTPTAISDRGGTITAVAASNHTGLIVVGNGSGNGLSITGGATGAGGVFLSLSALAAVIGTGGTGPGLEGVAAASGTAGVLGTGSGTSPGVRGEAGSTAIAGVEGYSDSDTAGTYGQSDGAGAALRALANGTGVGCSIVSGAGAAINASSESALATIIALNGDNGPVLNAEGSNAQSGPVALITNTAGASNATYQTLSIVANNSKGVTITTTGTGAGLTIVNSSTAKGATITTTTGTGLEVTVVGGKGIVIGGTTNIGIEVGVTSGIGIAVTATTGSALTATSAATTYVATITATAAGVPLKVDSASTETRVIQIAGPTPAASVTANNSINVANLTRAWVELPNLSSVLLSSGISFSVASVTASAAGRVIITFPAGTFPTANYIPQITWWDANSGGSSGTVIAPIMKFISRTATVFTMDVYSGLGTNTLINLTTANLGMSATFVGCGS